MPPRILKRGAAATGKRSAGRPSKKTMEDVAAPQQLKEKEEEEKPAVVVVDINEPGACSDGNGIGKGDKVVDEKKENEVNDSVDEYGKDERLDLDDHDPDYEHEEYCQVDYDEKNIDREDTQGVGDDMGEENEESLGEEEHAMHDEELEGFHEVEDEEDEEDACEEQERERLVDAEEEEEHHEVFKERRKRKEYEVFVGGLDKDATEDDLRKVFSQVGEIIEVRLMMNPQTKKNKGFAFLRFATIEQAKRAVAELKYPVINGKRCGVTPSQDSDTLFLGNICKTWTKEFLKEKLKHYGINNVEDLTLVEDSNNVGMNRGFAFLEFSSRSDAMVAFRRLQKRDVVFGVDRPARVSFADSFIDPGDEIMSQVKTVFVDGLPPSWDEDRLRELLKEYGKVEKVELARNMPAAKRKDFGFVTFDTHGAAVMCAKSINNSELGEQDNKAKVRARLSRPLQKGKGKYVNRIDFKGDFRSARGTGRVVRGSWGRPAPRSLPARGEREIRSRMPPANLKRSVGYRERRPHVSIPARARPIAPTSRSYDRRPPPRVPSYPKSSLRREYDQWDEIPPPRSRVVSDYSSRVVPERHSSYRDDYPSHGSGYSDLPRSSSRTSARRPYVDDGYGRYDGPPPSYREEHARDYVPISGTKRPYSTMDHVPSGYVDPDVRQSRARVDYYDYGGPATQYEDAYGDRLGRSTVGYSGSRSSLSSQDPRGLYGSRHDTGYGGSYGGADSGGMYSSSYGGDYMPRRDAGGSSHSTYPARSYSTYPGRSAGSSSYMGSGGSGSYY